MRFYTSLYFFVAALYLLTAAGRIGLSDGVAMLNVAQSIVRDGSLSSEPCDHNVSDPTNGSAIGCVPGAHGGRYAGFGLLPSLLVVPAILGAKLLSGMVHADPLVISKAAVSIFTLMLAPLVCVTLAAWVLKLGFGRRTAVISAFILAFASPFWHFSVKGFYSEPYFTLALLVAAYALSSSRRGVACAAAGLAFGAACATRLNGVILFPAFILSIAFYVRAHKPSIMQFVRESVYFSAAFSVFALSIAAANYVRFGSPLKTGYHLAFPSASAMLSTPMLWGLFKSLFSGEFGLVVFAPWVIFAFIFFPWFAREHLPEALLSGTIFSIYLLFFSKFSHLSGGWVAGPRYLIPTLPFLVVAMAPVIEYLQQPSVLKQRPWALAAVLMVVSVGTGLLIQSVGTMFPEERYYTLQYFYENKSEKPWWFGSVPFASIDFLSHVATPKQPLPRRASSDGSDQLSIERDKERAFANSATASSEDGFLSAFPNPENLTVPNLMLVKMKVLGFPRLFLFAYLTLIVFMGALGLLGLRKSAVQVQP
jgi:hypothetical protein